MTSRSLMCALAVAVLAVSASQAQLVSSHAPAVKPAAPAINPAAPKPVARVNGAVLTDMDLAREIRMIFPYAQQHGGAIPKAMEPEIRKGAMDMLIFEELLYQDAKRRNLQVAPERLTKAESQFRKQFPDSTTYQQYLKGEFKGSKALLREKIRRSLLIEKMMKLEVEQKAVVTPAMVQAYYKANSKQFDRAETVSIQTISIIPAKGASKEDRDEARLKIVDALRLAKEAKTSREFGLLAEQISEDDWRTNLGDRGSLELTQLPPVVRDAALKMKAGDTSDVLELEGNFLIFRLNERIAAGHVPFEQVKAELQSNLKKQKYNDLRTALAAKLRKTAKIEVL